MTALSTALRRLLAPGLLAALLAPPAALAQTDCPGEPLCRQTPRFSATLTDFRVSPRTVGNRPVNVTLRFTNRSDQPLTLGHVSGTAAAFDDRGHKYLLQNPRRLTGIGLIERQRFDPRLTLAPGESADAKLELNFFANHVVVGTRFDFELAVREIEALPGGQHRLGREHVLSWQSLGSGSGATAPAAAPPAGGEATTGPTVPAAGDACEGRPQCSASGPLLARLVGAGASTRGNYHHVLVRIEFRNLGPAPLILNYKAGTGQAVDERGEVYTVTGARESVQGMPVATRQSASSQFTLAPGEARQAAFDFRRFTGKVPAGQRLRPSLALEQYELLPSGQLQLQREYALSFGEVGAGVALSPPGDALKRLGEVLRKARP